MKLPSPKTLNRVGLGIVVSVLFIVVCLALFVRIEGPGMNPPVALPMALAVVLLVGVVLAGLSPLMGKQEVASAVSRKRELPTGDPLATILLQLERREEYQLARILTELDNATDDEFTEVSLRANDIAAIAKARLASLGLLAPQ